MIFFEKKGNKKRRAGCAVGSVCRPRDEEFGRKVAMEVYCGVLYKERPGGRCTDTGLHARSVLSFILFNSQEV